MLSSAFGRANVKTHSRIFMKFGTRLKIFAVTFILHYKVYNNFYMQFTMFENMVLRRIFGPRRDEVTGDWRRLHKEEINDLYSSPNIVRVIKSRRMRWAGHVACMGEERGCIGS